MKIRTEFRFVLPKGKQSEDEKPKKIRGVMRLIKVKDLIDIHRDNRVRENSAYFYVVLLSKVIIKLDDIKMMNTRVIENLSTENFAFLVDFMNEINHKVLSTFPVKCPSCSTIYTGDVTLVGEH